MGGWAAVELTVGVDTSFPLGDCLHRHTHAAPASSRTIRRKPTADGSRVFAGARAGSPPRTESHPWVAPFARGLASPLRVHANEENRPRRSPSPPPSLYPEPRRRSRAAPALLAMAVEPGAAVVESRQARSTGEFRDQRRIRTPFPRRARADRSIGRTPLSAGPFGPCARHIQPYDSRLTRRLGRGGGVLSKHSNRDSRGNKKRKRPGQTDELPPELHRLLGRCEPQECRDELLKACLDVCAAIRDESLREHWRDFILGSRSTFEPHLYRDGSRQILEAHLSVDPPRGDAQVVWEALCDFLRHGEDGADSERG